MSKGRIYTDAVTGEFLKLVRNHAHEGNAARVEVVRTLTSMKRRAVETQETPAVIRIEEMQELSVGALGQFPSREAVRLLIKQRRKEINAAPLQPLSCQKIINITEKITKILLSPIRDWVMETKF